MSRDYKSRKSSSKKMSGSSLIWGIFIGYVLGLISAMGIWLYLIQAPSPFLNEDRPVNLPLTRFDSDREQKEFIEQKEREKEIAKADEKPTFDFYKILPGFDEKTVVDETAFEQKILQHAVSVDNSEIYFLQAGSFRSVEEAESLKARLALLGMFADIKTANVPEKGVWYRVHIGPFTQMTEVGQTRLMLSQSGIETNLIKLKGEL